MIPTKQTQTPIHTLYGQVANISKALAKTTERFLRQRSASHK